MRFSAGAFFIWLSVFNLFMISLFWSKVNDSFTTEQSHRLYGYIAALALAGSSACMVVLGSIRTFGSRITPGSPEDKPIGGSLWAGIPLILKDPNLRGIALLIICYSTVSTVLYVEVADMARDLYPESGARTRFFATLDLSTNGLALAMQVLGTRKIVLSKGLRITLSSVPCIVFANLPAAALWFFTGYRIGSRHDRNNRNDKT